MEELAFLKEYSLILTAVIGGTSAVVTWYMSKRKVNIDATTSVHEQQRLNMQQLLKQNHELAADLGNLRKRMAELHEECNQLRNEVSAMRAWFAMRVRFCDACDVIEDGQKLFAKQPYEQKKD